MLQCAPKLGRNPLGDAGFDPPFGVDQRVGRTSRSIRRRDRQANLGIKQGELREQGEKVLAS